MKTFDTNKDTFSIIILFIILLIVSIYLQLSGWANRLEIASFTLTIGYIIGLLSSSENSDSQLLKYFSGLFTSVVIFILIIAQTLEKGNNLEKIVVLSFRVMADAKRLGLNLPLESADLFIFIISLLFLFIGFFGGFEINGKGHIWVTITIAVIGFTLIEILLPSDKQSWIISSIFIFLIFLLVIRRFFWQKKEFWNRKLISFEGSPRLESNWSIIASITMIIAISWTLPAITQKITDNVRIREANSALRNLEGPLRNLTYSMEDNDAKIQTTYPTKYVIGRSITNSEDVVFTIQTDQLLPEGFHHYWRGRVYDYYSNGIWSNSNSIEIKNFEITNNQIAASNLEVPSSYQIRIRQPLWTFFTTGNIQSLDRDAIFLLIPEMNDSKTIAGIFPNEAMFSGERYSFTSLRSFASENDLRNSTGDYPNWVLDNYLQLPDSLPVRVLELADQITVGFDTPYEKVMAVTDYLRSTIDYSENINKSPDGSELVDWLLFDSREGYCAYYATAEVILLRSIGIPARLVVGFAQGIEQDRGKSFIVRAKDSHAWPEVYFNNIGWVEFEPTTSLPRQFFSSEINNTISSDLENEPENSPPLINRMNNDEQSDQTLDKKNLVTKNESQKFIFWLSVILVAICSIIFLYTRCKMWIKRKKIRNLNQLILIILTTGKITQKPIIKKWISHLQTPKVIKDFRRLIKLSSLINLQFSPATTPREKITTITTLIPTIKDECELLLHEFVSFEYQMITKKTKAHQYSFIKISKALIKYRFISIWNI